MSYSLCHYTNKVIIGFSKFSEKVSSYKMSNLYNFSEDFLSTHFVVFYVHDIGIYVSVHPLQSESCTA